MSLYVLSAPSGAGKSTLVRRVLEVRPDVRLSVSHTTRLPRPGEVDGVAYHFVDEPTFRRMMAEDDFVEWAEVHGQLYGTSRGEVRRLTEAGFHVLFDVDVQGARAIGAAYPAAVSLFVLPPSMAELERRLRGRATEAEDVVQRRLRNARGELAEAPNYDYIIVNGALDEAVEDMLAVLRAGPLRTPFRKALVQRLQGEPYPTPGL